MRIALAAVLVLALDVELTGQSAPTTGPSTTAAATSRPSGRRRRAASGTADGRQVRTRVFRQENPDVAAVVKLAAKAPRLPAPKEPVIRVKTAHELYEANRTCPPGTTILLEDGLYKLRRTVVIRTDGVCLRGASGDREKVILDRQGGSEGVMLAGADDVLVADLTIRNCARMGVDVKGENDTQRTRIYNVKFHNIFVRAVKGTHPAGRSTHPPGRGDNTNLPDARFFRTRPTGGSIRYCLFVNDHRKTNARDGFGGNYVGGIDMMGLKNWTISDNVFVGIRGRTGGGRGAIFVWVHSEDVTVERNIIVNCDRGICFGNPSGAALHMTRGVARNNFIVAGVRRAFEIVRTRDTRVDHNTVYDPMGTSALAVHFFQGAEGDQFRNNIVHGRVNLQKGVVSSNNFIGDCAGWFVNPTLGDLHLTPAARAAFGAARPLADVTEDFDRRRRKAAPDLGAAEYADHPADRRSGP